jgi:hypothetical protein
MNQCDKSIAIAIPSTAHVCLITLRLVSDSLSSNMATYLTVNGKSLDSMTELAMKVRSYLALIVKWNLYFDFFQI